MAGTLAGGKEAAKTNKQIYGDDFYKRIGAMGGKKKVPKGYALMSKEKRVESGRKGGRNSKRGKA